MSFCIADEEKPAKEYRKLAAQSPHAGIVLAFLNQRRELQTQTWRACRGEVPAARALTAARSRAASALAFRQSALRAEVCSLLAASVDAWTSFSCMAHFLLMSLTGITMVLQAPLKGHG